MNYNKVKAIPYIIHEAPITATENRIIGENNGKPIAEGILQDADARNRNGRWYSATDLNSQIKSERTQELLKSGNLKGEDGHPMESELSRQQTIDPRLVSVKYLDVWMEGNLVKARFTGTNTQYGKAFNEDLLDGELPSFSLRALGVMENAAGKAYVKNLKIITWDRVIYPSHKRAYTQKLLSESAGASTQANEFVVQENYTGKIIPINDQRIIDFIKTESASLNMLSEVLEVPMTGMTVLKDGKVRLYRETGETIIMKPEEYIKNEIMDWAHKQ